MELRMSHAPHDGRCRVRVSARAECGGAGAWTTSAKARWRGPALGGPGSHAFSKFSAQASHGAGATVRAVLRRFNE
eukprot:2391494-Prymnesium_polylepis.2